MATSVIIPAHDEANVIERCLTALTAGARSGELEVIVVANACRDETAAVARTFAAARYPVTVIETQVPGKAHALNLGDRAASGFPRFYVDADVVLPHASVREVAGVLERDEALAAAPRVVFDLDGRSWSVRAFYDVWTRLPYCQRGMVGSGAYAVSTEGRRRFVEFPEITADDAFVRLKFNPRERVTVASCTFTVFPPTTLRDIIKIKTRSHFGNRELRAKEPTAFDNEGESHRAALVRLALDPSFWPKLAVYAFVRLVARVRTLWQYHFGDHRRWERDDSSRRGQSPTSAGRMDAT